VYWNEYTVVCTIPVPLGVLLIVPAVRGGITDVVVVVELVVVELVVDELVVVELVVDELVVVELDVVVLDVVVAGGVRVTRRFNDENPSGFVAHVLLTMLPAVHCSDTSLIGPEKLRVAEHPDGFAVSLPVKVPVGLG
jgi:hypothetical protein